MRSIGQEKEEVEISENRKVGKELQHRTFYEFGRSYPINQ